MPVRYYIEPELNILVYVGTGLCTGQELLKAERLASQDESRRLEMKILLDVRHAEVDVDLNDIHDLIELNANRIKQGINPEPTALLTRTSKLDNFVEIIKLLAGDFPLKMGIFHNLNDALRWLELSKNVAEVNQLIEKAHEKHTN